MSIKPDIVPWIAVFVTLAGGVGTLGIQFAGAQREKNAEQDALVIKVAESNSVRAAAQSVRMSDLSLRVGDNTERIAALETKVEFTYARVHTDSRGKR